MDVLLRFTEDEGLTWSNSIFGFLLGSTLSGAGLYYYVVDEYRVSNELLSEDVYVSFPPNECEVLAQSIEHSTYTMICRRFNPPSRGWKATSRAWSRMSSRGSKERTRQQRQ
jgi:hypothetical protein